MSGSVFGTIFRVSTWGESHGKAIGAVIDGCLAGLPLCEADIQPYLDRRKPGSGKYVTQRKEADEVQILSGIFDGKTTGTPIYEKNETGESGASQASRHGICCDGTPDEPWKSDRSCEDGDCFLLSGLDVVWRFLYLYQSVSVDQQLLSDGIEIQPLEACKTGGSGTVLCLGNYGDLLDFYRCTP